MAIYHCSIKTISRSKGRSATAAAAYRSGVCIVDERTGEVYDYTRKRGIEHTEIILPQGFSYIEREQLWNNAEAAENRKNSTVAREYELALPDELNQVQRRTLVVDFTQHLVDRYGVAADVAIHAPGRGGDQRNYHAHILTTTRRIGVGGVLRAKTRSLDNRRSGEVEHIRATWGRLVNQALERGGHSARVSHKSLEDQGIDRVPGLHWGPAVTAMERRGLSTDRGQLHRDMVEAHRLQAAEKIKSAAIDRIATGMAGVQDKVQRLRREAQAKAVETVRLRELERVKVIPGIVTEVRQEPEEPQKKAGLETVKNRGRGGPGMGR